MQNLKKTSTWSLTCIAVLCLATLIWQTSPTVAAWGSNNAVALAAAQATPTPCPQISVPATTKGFTSGQDVFALPQPVVMSISSAANATVNVFNVSPATFGGTVAGIGGLTGLSPQGVSFSTPNSSVNLLSCVDSIWDIAFEIAGTGNTIGDRVTLLLTIPGGTAVSVATFTIEAGGARLTSINSGARLFLNNRQASGTALGAGTLIPFGTAAGTAGSRTDLLLLAISMDPGAPFTSAPFNGCFQLGANITRGTGVGTTSLLITDLQVTRTELPGDRARIGTGLLFGFTGGFPTGLACPNTCTPCTVAGGGGQGPQAKCDTICFNSPIFLVLGAARWLNGNVVVPGVNFNIPLNAQANRELIIDALQGRNLFTSVLNPTQRFTQQYVAAQINLFNGTAGGALTSNVLWSNISCYGVNFVPVTLSNGVVLSPNSMLKDLFMQATLITSNPVRTNADLNALSDIFALLNGNSLVSCNARR